MPSAINITLIPAAKAKGPNLLASKAEARTIGRTGKTQGLIKVSKPARYAKTISIESLCATAPPMSRVYEVRCDHIIVLLLQCLPGHLHRQNANHNDNHPNNIPNAQGLAQQHRCNHHAKKWI